MYRFPIIINSFDDSIITFINDVYLIHNDIRVICIINISIFNQYIVVTFCCDSVIVLCHMNTIIKVEQQRCYSSTYTCIRVIRGCMFVSLRRQHTMSSWLCL